MPSKQEDKDSKVKTPKNRKSSQGKNKKIVKKSEDTDSDSDSDWVPPSEHHSDSGSEEMVNEDMNPRELQKFMQKIFPSEAGKERLKQMEKIDNMILKNKKSSKKKGKKKESPINKKRAKRKKTVKKKVESEEEAEEESSDDEIDDVLILDDDDDEGYDEDEIQEMLSSNMKFNIIFTVGDVNLEDEEGEDEDEDED